MKRKDDLHRYGVVVEYNTGSFVRGLGSAIFFHVWAAENEPTNGCVAMSEASIVRMLAWLDPSARPIAVMGAENDLAAMESPAVNGLLPKPRYLHKAE